MKSKIKLFYQDQTLANEIKFTRTKKHKNIMKITIIKNEIPFVRQWAYLVLVGWL